MAAVASCIGAEGVSTGAGGDAILNSPQDRIVVECTCCHVSEGIGAGSSLTALCTGQEGNDLTAVAGFIGGEGAINSLRAVFAKVASALRLHLAKTLR